MLANIYLANRVVGPFYIFIYPPHFDASTHYSYYDFNISHTPFYVFCHNWHLCLIFSCCFQTYTVQIYVVHCCSQVAFHSTQKHLFSVWGHLSVFALCSW